MDFRHNAARRRRVMRDERLDVEQITRTEAVAQPFRRYQAEAVFSQQPSTMDLVPKTPWSTGICVTCLLAVSVFLLVLPNWQPAGDSLWAEALRRTEWWSIDQAGSLGQTLLLGLGAAHCLLCYQIYHLRRHRSDDYHGAYQVWWWALGPAMGLAIANMMVPAQLLGFLWQALVPQLGLTLWSVLTISAAGAMIVGLTVRLYYELRESWGSVLGLVCTALAFTGYVVLACNAQFEVWTPAAWGAWLQPAGWWLMANGFLASTLLVYLNYVHRDVLGSIIRTVDDSQGNTAQRESIESVVAAETATNPELPRGGAAVKPALENDYETETATLIDPPENGILARRKRRRVA